MKEQLQVNEKKLYHIQSVTEYSDDPLDFFLLSSEYPNDFDIKKAVLDDIEDNAWIDDITNNAQIYSVYATEVK